MKKISLNSWLFLKIFQMGNIPIGISINILVNQKFWSKINFLLFVYDSDPGANHRKI